MNPDAISGLRARHVPRENLRAAGRAVEGPLTGARLRPAPGVQHFWFSHAAFAGE